MNKDNIILIGMPGSGKSTVGVVLAKNRGLSFMDSDICIQEQEQQLLHEIIKEKGIDGFIEVENRINASLCVEKSVIATGGSAIYGSEAMEHLREIGTIVYLQLNFETICERLGDLDERGVVLREKQNLFDLYQERTPLYDQYAQITVNCEEKSIRDIVLEIVNKIP